METTMTIVKCISCWEFSL